MKSPAQTAPIKGTDRSPQLGSITMYDAVGTNPSAATNQSPTTVQMHGRNVPTTSSAIASDRFESTVIGIALLANAVGAAES